MRTSSSSDDITRCVVIRPELRDSDIERDRLANDRSEHTVYWQLNANVPPRVDDSELHTRASFRDTVRACLPEQIQTVVTPEPLWVRYWPRTLGVVLIAQIMRKFLGRNRFSVGLYAIDNLDPAERFSHPRFDRYRGVNRIARFVLRPMLRASIAMSVDRIVFGTSQAEANYRAGGILPRRSRLRTTVIPERHGTCLACFGSSDPAETPRERRVLFLGEFATRKGVDTLLDAWAAASLRHEGWSLTLCGRGALSPEAARASDDDPTVTVAQPSRAEIHELLRTSTAVVLPSRRVPRWQEQVGLSMLEGESHGCALIVSRDSGAALDLAQRAAAQVIEPGDVDDLARALDALPTARRARPVVGDTNRDVQNFLIRGVVSSGAA